MMKLNLKKLKLGIMTWSNYSARKIPLTLCNDGQKSKYS
jgi:hypothetical protein